ncbi:UNVERIFIED_CONTAM: hypothetical protein PYX00_009210 [Menopon gallinae]|uniref:Fork-head domain-containing protein n=1 Tax=Menopon gallinae TaxID=328185 RepID=A0AAW2HAQ4_9NEOP
MGYATENLACMCNHTDAKKVPPKEIINKPNFGEMASCETVWYEALCGVSVRFFILLKAMAPERSGQGLIPSNTVVKQEVVGPPKQTSILEDFLEIKIKEELEYRENCGEGARSKIKREEDQDLTSLTWLQNNNLLKTLTLPETVKKVKHEESPTSDLAEETGSDSSTQSSRHSPAVPVESPTPVAMMEDSRPLEKFASNNSSKQYITATKEKHHYSVPYDPQLHVNSKPPYSFSCLIFMAIEDSHARALPVKEIYSWITDHFPYFIKAPTGWKNSVRHNLSLNKCFRKVDKAPNLGKGSLWIVDPQYRPNLLNALSKAPYHPCASLDRPAKPPILPSTTLPVQQQELIAIKSQNRLPNPELFPYLSKRLAASEADRINEAEERSNGSHDTYSREYVQQKYMRKRLKMRGDELIPLISTSPSEDHTYTVEYPSVNFKQSQPVSPDEAYDSNDDNSRQYTDDFNKSKSLEDDEESWSSDGAEQRNVASALLHLAGGSRKRGSESSLATPSSAKRSISQRAKRIHHRPTILQRSPKKHNRGRHLDDMSNNNNNNNDKGYSGRPIFKPKIEQHYSNTR